MAATKAETTATAIGATTSSTTATTVTTATTIIGANIEAKSTKADKSNLAFVKKTTETMTATTSFSSYVANSTRG